MADQDGQPFYDDSFGEQKMGCPFALDFRYPAIKEQVEYFLRGYKAAGIGVDFIFADWEIDGPIEWNDAWANSKKCRRCPGAYSEHRRFSGISKGVADHSQPDAKGSICRSGEIVFSGGAGGQLRGVSA